MWEAKPLNFIGRLSTPPPPTSHRLRGHRKVFEKRETIYERSTTPVSQKYVIVRLDTVVNTDICLYIGL